MADVEVSGDVRAVVTFDQQLTYAAARALTQTAKDSQTASVEAIRRTFTTRGAWYMPGNRFGVRITPATKARLEGAVRTAADWLIPHETGEDKVASGGGPARRPPRRSRAASAEQGREGSGGLKAARPRRQGRRHRHAARSRPVCPTGQAAGCLLRP